MQLPLFDRPDLYPHAPRKPQGTQAKNAKQPQLQPIIEGVIGTLGTIDLDPHSDTFPVPAKAHFTPRERALSKMWRGRVWLNAPTGRTLGKWVCKLVDEYENGEVTEAIALLPARPNADWWKDLAKYPFCALHNKLTYAKPDGSITANATPYVVFYLGSQLARFHTRFSKLGTVYIPYG